MLNIVICDDDIAIIQYLRKLVLDHFSHRNIQLYTFSSVHTLSNALQQGLQPDIAIMDIVLGEDDGIQFSLQQFSSLPQIQVIFITGYIEYCSSVYEVEQVYFLLKPIHPAAFQRALEKAFCALDSIPQKSLTIQTKSRIHRVPFRAIRYLESQGRKVIVHCRDETLTCYATLASFTPALPSHFVHCHKSFFVNLEFVQKMEFRQFILDTNEEIPISQSKRVQTKQLFFAYLSRQS